MGKGFHDQAGTFLQGTRILLLHRQFKRFPDRDRNQGATKLFQVIFDAPELAARQSDGYQGHTGFESEESRPLRSSFQSAADRLAPLGRDNYTAIHAQGLQRGGNGAPVRLTAVNPDDTEQIAQPAEQGEITYFDFGDHFGEIRQGRHHQDRVRVTQVVDDDQRRAAAGIILPPDDRCFCTDKYNHAAQELEKTPENAPPDGQLWQAGEIRAPNFANGLRGRRQILLPCPEQNPGLIAGTETSVTG